MTYSQIFVPGQPRKSFDGVGVFTTDPASGGTPAAYAFASDMIRFIKSDNRDYPDAIDNAGMTHMSIPGVKTGIVTVSGFLQPDRNFHTLMNTAFGPRTNGQLTPWTMALIPWGGGAQIKATGLWWNTLQLTARYAQRGGDGRVAFVLNGVVADPDNTLSLPDQAIPAAAGLPGAGVSHFIQSGFTDGQVSPTTYDNVRAFSLGLNNQFSPQPSSKNRSARIGSGYTPGPLKGTYSLTQTKNATQALPRIAGVYPQELLLPTGDASHTLTIDLSTSYDDDGMSFSPNDFAPDVIGYSLFYQSAGATTTATWPMVASYA